MEMPKPEAATRNISTISRFLLKYWATISVEVSRVRPTPRPKGQTNIIKPKGKHQKEGYPWVPVLMPLFFKSKEELILIRLYLSSFKGFLGPINPPNESTPIGLGRPNW